MSGNKNGYYTLTTGNDSQGRDAYAEYDTKGRYIYGVAVGILIMPTNTPMAPGNMGNASTFNFPVLFESIGEIDPFLLVAKDPSPLILEKIIAAAKRLQNQGVRSIVGNCGFFANYQQQVAANLDIPFFSSSLMQVPFAVNSLGAGQKVGVITADSSKLCSSPAMALCGLADQKRTVIYGLEHTKPMQDNFALKGNYSLQAMEDDLVETAQKMVKDHPEIGAIVLECTELSMHARAVQDAVKLNVWDFTTMVDWMQSGAVRRQFTGWI
jgi:Asp/Glu/hydantoin racemase